MNASTNDVAFTTQLRQQSAAIGITEFLLGCMEFNVGTDETDEPMQQNGAQAMHDGLGDFVASMAGSHEINPAQFKEQQQCVSAVVVRLGVTGVYQKIFIKVRNAGSRVWDGVFGRRAERALQE